MKLTAEYQHHCVSDMLVGGGYQPNAEVLTLHGYLNIKAGRVAVIICGVERIDGSIWEAYTLMPLDKIRAVAA